MEHLHYGVAYYDEYMPYNRLEEDISLMKEAGITVVRIAESTWSTHEPQEGVFDFSSVDRVLDAMYDAGIDVIIGTPTYAIPTWMAKRYPDVLATTINGQGKYGARQIMDITNPTYLFYAERIIRKLMNHVKDHPAIIGYQIDNETKHYGTAGENVQHQFIKYVKKEFQTIDNLNDALGLDYWSNRINAWEDFPSVIGTINGSLGGVFAKFQRELVTEFLAWQVAIVTEYKKAHQFVTQNFDFEWRGHSYGIQPDVDHFKASKPFDITGVDIYHPSQDELTGIEISFGGDVARSTKKKNYLVLETQAQAFTHWTPYPGQLTLQAFSHIASGASMVAYWHWHSIHNSFETYWKGLLSHDFKPNYLFDEAKLIGYNFKKLSPDLFGLNKINDVAFLISNEALTSLEWFKLGLNSDVQYNDILRRYYDELYKLNIECDFLSTSNTNDFSKYKLIIVPALYTASDQLLKQLNDYTKNGGHVLYTFKTGFTNEYTKVRHTQQPGIIHDVCGIEYNMFVEPKNVRLKSDIIHFQSHTTVSDWIELIIPTSADVLAWYDHDYWGKYAAVTTNTYHNGRASYVGGFICPEATRDILIEVLHLAGIDVNLENTYPIIIKKAINRNGETIHFYFNYSNNNQVVKHLYDVGTELISEEQVLSDQNLHFTPWDLKIIKY